MNTSSFAPESCSSTIESSIPRQQSPRDLTSRFTNRMNSPLSSSYLVLNNPTPMNPNTPLLLHEHPSLLFPIPPFLLKPVQHTLPARIHLRRTQPPNITYSTTSPQSFAIHRPAAPSSLRLSDSSASYRTPSTSTYSFIVFKPPRRNSPPSIPIIPTPKTKPFPSSLASNTTTVSPLHCSLLPQRSSHPPSLPR